MSPILRDISRNCLLEVILRIFQLHSFTGTIWPVLYDAWRKPSDMLIAMLALTFSIWRLVDFNHVIFVGHSFGLGQGFLPGVEGFIKCFVQIPNCLILIYLQYIMVRLLQCIIFYTASIWCRVSLKNVPPIEIILVRCYTYRNWIELYKYGGSIYASK